jgi:hypothetical protein
MEPQNIETQLQIMSKKIKQSKKKWKIVCGHHPWRSVGGHGNADPDLERFFTRLSDKSNFDLYMCGHDHCKNVILKKKGKKNIHLLVIGTGGKKYHAGENGRPIMKNMMEGDSDLLFHSPNLGSCHITATKKKIKLVCYTENLEEEFTHIIQK